MLTSAYVPFLKDYFSYEYDHVKSDGAYTRHFMYAVILFIGKLVFRKTSLVYEPSLYV